MANNFYFTRVAEDAIVKYNESDNQNVRSKIYREQIYKPINKLVENIINRFKFPYSQEVSENLQAEVVSFLVLNMHKYDQSLGKAFSYFSILAKNYLILNNTKQYKHKKIQQRIDTSDGENSFDIIDEVIDYEHNDEIPEFVSLLIEYWDNNLSYIFTKKPEMMIADAIMVLFKRSGFIENFNKKSLYVLIREMTGLRTQYITSVVNKMRDHINLLEKKYNNTGCFNVIDPIDDFL